MTFCHSCCLQLLLNKNFNKLLNIINPKQGNFIWSTFTIKLRYHILFPIDIIIDIIRNILSFPNIVKYLFDKAPNVWKNIFMFWKVVCLTYSKYGVLFTVDPKIMNKNYFKQKNNPPFTVYATSKFQKVCQQIVCNFTYSLMNTISLWKVNNQWKYLLNTNEFNIVQFIGLHCGQLLDLYKIDLLNVWNHGKDVNPFLDGYYGQDKTPKPECMLLFMREMPLFWNLMAFISYLKRKHKAKVDDNLIYSQINKYINPKSCFSISKSKFSSTITEEYIFEMGGILKGWMYTMMNDKSQIKRAVKVNKERSSELMGERICSLYKCKNTETRKYKKCSNCELVYYCSRKCQKYDWKYVHKYQCKIFHSI
eukprot:237040_1